MSLRLIIEPEAETDIDTAAAWYEKDSLKVALAFLSAVDDAIDAIWQNPHQYQVVHHHHRVRRAPIKRFPYGLMYVFSESEIIVVGCFHGCQNPERWRDRLL